MPLFMFRAALLTMSQESPSKGKNEEVVFGSQLPSRGATSSVARALVRPRNTLVERFVDKPLYGATSDVIEISGAVGENELPCEASLHDVLGDGNCCFRVIAKIL